MASQGAQEAQGNGCAFFDVEVPDAWTYTSAFVNDLWMLSGIFVSLKAAQYEGIRDYIDRQIEKGNEEVANALDKALESTLWKKRAYIETFCKIHGFKTALLIEDWGSETWDVVVFDLPEDEIKRIVNDMLNYIDTVGRADGLAEGDERDAMEACLYLDNADVSECLAKAREILARAKAEAGR